MKMKKMKRMRKQTWFALLALALLIFSVLPVSASLPTKAFDIPENGLLFRFDGNADEASGAVSGKLRGSPRYVEGRDGTPEGAIFLETEDQAVALGLNDVDGSWTASFWSAAALPMWI